MTAPVIGITCRFDESAERIWLSKYYAEAVAAAGGVPLMLPVTAPLSAVPQLLNLCAGLILPGGGDIDPLLFGEQPHPAGGEICPAADAFELQAAKVALQKDMPVFGICRGAQVLNVAAGGTVCQDISRQISNPIKHNQAAPKWYPTHTVTPVEGTLFAKLLGTKPIKVNSFHHQMVGKPGSGIVVAAAAPDGVIEAVEHRHKKFVIGVQYHPEVMYASDRLAFKLFAEFVKSARQCL